MRSYRDAARQPPLRSTGVTIDLDVEYSNKDKHGRVTFQLAEAPYAKIDATIRLRARTDAWTGLGITPQHVHWPSQPLGARRLVARALGLRLLDGLHRVGRRGN